VRRAGWILLAIAFAFAPSGATAQSTALARAMARESAGEWREAIVSYREALQHGDMMAALLGLERVYAQLGWNDTLVTLVDSVAAKNPADVAARTSQLRVLQSLRRNDQARAAFRDWTRAVPEDITPYREWARILLGEGMVAQVDTVLQQAQRALGSLRGLAVEIAQLRAALGQWDHATVAWREAIRQQEYLESAAAFSLRAAPVEQRRVVRAVLLSPPVDRGARRLLASIELSWGNGREGWVALSELPLGDSTAAVWTAFADDAERRGQWLAARDALLAVQQWRPDGQRALRAATLALEGGDPRSSLDLLQQALTRLGPRDGPRAILTLQLRALGTLGRGAEAQRAYEAVEAQLSQTERAAARHLVAWAWVRGGGVDEAKAMLSGAAPDPDDELTGWLALYDGRLDGARQGLRRANARDKDAIAALAFVSRTRVDSAPVAGAAYLALARGDSMRAAATFVRAAPEVTDAAAVLMLMASRIYMDQRKENEALAVWQILLDQYGKTPEAAEAELEWARLLRKRGDAKGAIAHLEHLILTWPESALLPQARRELDIARGTVPSGGL
jgi:tetratricopeptide (TPR) repeat protein